MLRLCKGGCGSYISDQYSPGLSHERECSGKESGVSMSDTEDQAQVVQLGGQLYELKLSHSMMVAFIDRAIEKARELGVSQDRFRLMVIAQWRNQ
jgi:hypothetical protein